MKVHLLAVIFLTTTGSAFAGSVSLEAFSGVVAGTNTCQTGGQPAAWSFFGTSLGFDIGGTGNGISDCNLQGGISDVITAGVPATSSQSLNNVTPYGGPFFSGVTYSGSSSASANFGIISVGAYGSLSAYNGASTNEAEAGAFGLATDALTFIPTGNNSGSNGFAQLQFTINGTFTGTASAFGGLEANIKLPLVNGGNPAKVFSGTTGGISVPSSIPAGCVQPPTQAVGFTCTNAVFSTQLLSVDFNTPSPYELGLEVVADLGNGPANVEDPTTLELTGIKLYTSSYQPIDDFTITSSSGAAYGAHGLESEPADAPEPATWLGASTALIAAGFLRRYRRAG
jgi:hypothetical protein